MHQEIREWLKGINAIETLQEYIRMRSRSNHEAEVLECAGFSRALLEEVGLVVELIPTSGNPIILGNKGGEENGIELLIYGHYDVQPEGDLELWQTEPFDPVIKESKLYGRGSADNKGQHFAHIKALQYLKETYPETYRALNVKFILDGDEERGSFSLAEVFETRSEDLRSDLIIVSDGPALVADAPTVVGSVRGILTFQITIQHNPEDLHSGNFGGFGRSAALDMLNLLSAMIDHDGRAKIPGFYDRVDEATPFEQEKLRQLDDVYQTIMSERGFAAAITQRDQTVATQNQFWPTLNINGIAGGGVKKERRTIIPAEITASLDCRLVPSMDSEELKSKIQAFISSWAAENHCENAITITFEHAMEAVGSSFTNPYLGLLQDALRYGFEAEPRLVPRLGGSLPLYLFPEYLGREVFLVPLALPDENNHAPNENLDLPYFEKGVIAMVKFFQLVVNSAKK